MNLAPFTTLDKSELVSWIPLRKTQTKIVIFSYQLKTLKVGDWVYVTCDMQVTNPYRYNAMFASQLILADSPTSTSGTEISEASSTNVTPGQHHLQACRSGLVEVGNSLIASRTFVNFVGSAAANQAGNDRLKVDSDYGRLFGLHIIAD